MKPRTGRDTGPRLAEIRTISRPENAYVWREVADEAGNVLFTIVSGRPTVFLFFVRFCEDK